MPRQKRLDKPNMLHHILMLGDISFVIKVLTEADERYECKCQLKRNGNILETRAGKIFFNNIPRKISLLFGNLPIRVSMYGMPLLSGLR